MFLFLHVFAQLLIVIFCWKPELTLRIDFPPFNSFLNALDINHVLHDLTTWFFKSTKMKQNQLPPNQRDIVIICKCYHFISIASLQQQKLTILNLASLFGSRPKWNAILDSIVLNLVLLRTTIMIISNKTTMTGKMIPHTIILGIFTIFSNFLFSHHHLVCFQKQQQQLN